MQLLQRVKYFFPVFAWKGDKWYRKEHSDCIKASILLLLYHRQWSKSLWKRERRRIHQERKNEIVFTEIIYKLIDWAFHVWELEDSYDFFLIFKRLTLYSHLYSRFRVQTCPSSFVRGNFLCMHCIGSSVDVFWDFFNLWVVFLRNQFWRNVFSKFEFFEHENFNPLLL